MLLFQPVFPLRTSSCYSVYSVLVKKTRQGRRKLTRTILSPSFVNPYVTQDVYLLLRIFDPIVPPLGSWPATGIMNPGTPFTPVLRDERSSAVTFGYDHTNEKPLATGRSRRRSPGGGLPSTKLTWHSTKLCTRFKIRIPKEKNSLVLMQTSIKLLVVCQISKVVYLLIEAYKQNFELIAYEISDLQGRTLVVFFFFFFFFHMIRLYFSPVDMRRK